MSSLITELLGNYMVIVAKEVLRVVIVIPSSISYTSENRFEK